MQVIRKQKLRSSLNFKKIHFERIFPPQNIISENNQKTINPSNKIKHYLCSMNKVKINKKIVVKSVIKMISDKETVRSYMKGNTSKNTLSKKGIKLANPL